MYAFALFLNQTPGSQSSRSRTSGPHGRKKWGWGTVGEGEGLAGRYHQGTEFHVPPLAQPAEQRALVVGVGNRAPDLPAHPPPPPQPNTPVAPATRDTKGGGCGSALTMAAKRRPSSSLARAIASRDSCSCSRGSRIPNRRIADAGKPPEPDPLVIGGRGGGVMTTDAQGDSMEGRGGRGCER